MNAQEALIDIGYTKKEARQVLPSLFLYLFRAFNQTELYRRARQVNPTVDLFRLMPRIPLMGEITLHDKVSLFALYRGVNPGIKVNSYIKSVVLASKEVLSWLSQYADMPAYTVAQVHRLEARAITNPEVCLYMEKFIYRKMRFILNSYGTEKAELSEALQERAIHNLRINYPNWNNAGEMLAMVKHAIANAGHNLIKYYAAAKRAKVDKNNKAVEYSLEGIQEMGGDAPEYQALIYSESLDRTFDICEASLSVDSLIKAYANTPRKRLLIELLSGRPHSGFSEFLSVECSEYADSVSFDKLLVKVCSYIGIDVDVAMPFLKTIPYKRAPNVKVTPSNTRSLVANQ